MNSEERAKTQQQLIQAMELKVKAEETIQIIQARLDGASDSETIADVKELADNLGNFENRRKTVNAINNLAADDLVAFVIVFKGTKEEGKTEVGVISPISPNYVETDDQARQAAGIIKTGVLTLCEMGAAVIQKFPTVAKEMDNEANAVIAERAAEGKDAFGQPVKWPSVDDMLNDIRNGKYRN